MVGFFTFHLRQPLPTGLDQLMIFLHLCPAYVALPAQKAFQKKHHNCLQLRSQTTTLAFIHLPSCRTCLLGNRCSSSVALLFDASEPSLPLEIHNLDNRACLVLLVRLLSHRTVSLSCKLYQPALNIFQIILASSLPMQLSPTCAWPKSSLFDVLPCTRLWPGLSLTIPIMQMSRSIQTHWASFLSMKYLLPGLQLHKPLSRQSSAASVLQMLPLSTPLCLRPSMPLSLHPVKMHLIHFIFGTPHWLRANDMSVGPQTLRLTRPVMCTWLKKHFDSCYHCLIITHSTSIVAIRHHHPISGKKFMRIFLTQILLWTAIIHPSGLYASHACSHGQTAWTDIHVQFSSRIMPGQIISYVVSIVHLKRIGEWISISLLFCFQFSIDVAFFAQSESVFAPQASRPPFHISVPCAQWILPTLQTRFVSLLA